MFCYLEVERVVLSQVVQVAARYPFLEEEEGGEKECSRIFTFLKFISFLGNAFFVQKGCGGERERETMVAGESFGYCLSLSLSLSLSEFLEHQFALCTLPHHRQLVNHLVQLAGQFIAFSTAVGINNESVLDNVPFFDLVSMAPQDVMHVILEGGLSHETRLLLEHCIVGMQYFTLDQLNQRIDDFPYGYAERSNKPSPITLAHIQAPGTSLGHQKGRDSDYFFRLRDYILFS